MTLVDASAAAAHPAPDPDPMKVAILVFNAVEIVDFSGPYEMFGAAGCDVYTVAATKDAVTSAMGLTIVPKYSFADAPQPDILVVPGGGVRGAAKDAATLQWIRDVNAHTLNTLSVCNGAFILASAGLLDGLTATTTYGNIPKLASQFPSVTVVRDRRWVDNGRIVTAAGLSAGIDGALHVIAKQMGEGTAQEVALGEEYRWESGAGFVRGMLADHEITAIPMDSLGTWKVLRTEGDTKCWDLALEGHSDLALGDLSGQVEQALVRGKWTRVEASDARPGSHTSGWRFTGTDGKPWKATLKIENVGGAAHQFAAAIQVARAG